MAATIRIFAKPATLWRYRALSRLVSRDGSERDRLREEVQAICDGVIWSSPYRRMNDPMEGLYERQAARFSNATLERDLADRMFGEKSGLGIASLTETWDNELMWAHYADAFQGICVGYNLDRLLAGLPDGTALSRVVYADRPRGIRLKGTTNLASRARAVLSTKSARWSYEREWRMFSPIQGPVRHGPGVIGKVLLGTRIPEFDERYVREQFADSGIEVMKIAVDGYRIGRR